jgi:hypothetical protein
MNTRFVVTSLFAALSGLPAGCISSHSTSYTDIERVKVSFASEKAGRIFYEALSKSSERTPREESKSSVNLILIDFESRKVTGPNKFFNEAVATCDTDQNGTISEQEAEIFAAAPRR